MKSGQDRTSSYRARVHVSWPHECVDSILAKRTYTYKELSGSALAAGSIASLFRTSEFFQCPESIQVYLQHVSFIFHCLSYSHNVQAVLDFHASILAKIEAGLLTWSRSHEATITLQRLNFRSGLKELPVSQSAGSSTEDTKKKREEEARRKVEMEKSVCSEYKDGNCPQSGDHGGKRHVCHFCWWKRGNTNALHAPGSCPFGPKKK